MFCLLLLGLVFAPVTSRAQLISFAKGASYSSSTQEWTSGYEVQYRQKLYQDLAVTFDYLNEGHFTGHHPDGYGLELWYRLWHPRFDRLTVAVGAGSFYYFDTITPPGGLSTDSHGFAPMVSLTARGRIWKKLDWVVSANSINPSHDVKDEQINVGLGYWLNRGALDEEAEPRGIFEPAEDGSALEGSERDELSLYGVFSVINNVRNPNAWGGSAEYRYRFAQDFDATVAYIYEGDPQVARRSGVTAQIWPVRTDVTTGFEVGAGFGVYGFVDKKRQPLPGQVTSVAAAPVVSLMVSHAFLTHWFGRFIFDRVVSNYNRDADIWRLGVGHTL
jgi:hypothetical protein